MNRQTAPARWRRRSTALGVLALALAFQSAPGLARDAEASDDPSIALVAKVIPSVVAIHTQRSLAIGHDEPDQGGRSPNIQRAAGSGFIVSTDGFIATNKHVVDGAYDVTVTLYDGRTSEAKVVWTSTVVDVAFLKIETEKLLSPVVLASDGNVRLGQHVIAIGNPQGLGISVSAGVVSALDRNIKQSPYDDFIQTDAAINHGSSGGPLFNEAGEVIGMNSILWASNNGGSEGIGFAIPSSDLSFLIDQLRRDRRIRCGSLGLKGQQVTPAMEDALSFPGPDGVIIATVDAAGPAARAGLRRGDIIRTFDGKALNDITTLNRAACLALDRSVPVEVWREGRFLSLDARVAEVEEGALAAGSGSKRSLPLFANAHDLGLTLAPIDDKTRRTYGLGADVGGFVVISVAAASQAETSGLSAGDIIMSLQMKQLSATEAFDDAFAQYGRTGHRNVVALVRSSGGERWVTLPVRLNDTP